MRNFLRLVARLGPRTLGLGSIAAAAAGALLGSQSCASVDAPPAEGGGSGGGGPVLAPGDVCSQPSPAQIKIRFEAPLGAVDPDSGLASSFVAVPPCPDPAAGCVHRTIKVVVDPDFCAPTQVTFDTSDAAVIAAPDAGTVGLYAAEVPITITGGAKPGTAKLTAHVPRGDGTTADATLVVDVIEPTLPTCTGTVQQAGLAAGASLVGGAGLPGASISIPKGADAPEKGSFLWSVPAFDASIACGSAALPAGTIALGPAVTFGPEAMVLHRELPLSIPVNPALLPEAARWRHLRIAYSGPAFKEPRTIPVADARVEKVDGHWAVTFKAPRLGTYQAVVRSDAGTKLEKRRLTHRAVVGVSMGGGGTAMFGMRHHDLFDVLAPLGGPVDWTWMIWSIEQNHLGGFRPIAPGTQLADIQLTATPCTTAAECKPDEKCIGVIESPATPGKCTLMPVPQDPYEHPQAFNNWWIEYPRTGTGGKFARDEYAQIFRDLALMFGNPNGDNLTKGAENLPAGVHPDDPSQVGDHPNGECKVWVDPLGDSPDKAKQEEIAQNCPIERCSHPLTLQNYFDDEYNPDGTFPVISVCDGAEQNEALSPYANTWAPQGNDYPLEVGLAVDYNGNGVRDELEPLIRAGHEKWDDFGTDGVPSSLEPGYAPGVNDDPAGDDYNAQYNPAGTENDHRFEPGETFYDTGLDGVAGTKQQPAYPVGYQVPGDGYDVGEGDGKFTVTRGLQTFWDRDPHSIARQMSSSVPGGELTDQALSRVDVWTDGGTRDLFNFAVDAQHLTGSFAARGRDVAYFTDFTNHPGQDPAHSDQYVPPRTAYEDLQGIVLQRYGKLDPTQDDIDKGSGQHVGTANELVNRLQSAFFFIGSRWPEPELRAQVAKSADNPAPNASQCEIIGNCTIEFTSSFGRTGPVGITLPPGYAHADQQWRRYPVVYVLHGYGQTPEDLEASIVLVHNWMNSPIDGIASRLPKAILVYVDGRCRVDSQGRAECIRGTFFADSVREEGVLDESWWLELMDYVDQNYRTMGETDVDWTE